MLDVWLPMYMLPIHVVYSIHFIVDVHAKKVIM